MMTFLSDSLMSLVTFFSENVVSAFDSNMQNISVLFSSLSLSGYVIPVEGAIMGILLFLGTYVMLEHHQQLLSEEKFRLAVGMIRWTYAPLVLLRSGLEDTMKKGMAADHSKLETLLEHTECVINCNRYVMYLDKADWKKGTETLTSEVEVHSYIQAVADQCRSYANSHHIQIDISHSPGYRSCKINEIIMTTALQHLLNRMIEATTPGSCIHISVSHNSEAWNLLVSNCKKVDDAVDKKSFISFLPLSDNYLRTVKKMIRLHGGKLAVYRYGKSTMFQITVPANCNCKDIEKPEALPDKQTEHMDKDIPHILLVMADNKFGNYLKDVLSGEFSVLVQKHLDLSALASVNKKPDAIIIDENVDSMCGNELCRCIKMEDTTATIPVILLVEYGNNKKYLSYAGSKADRLELRTTDIHWLKADLHMLIDNYLSLHKRTCRMLAEMAHMFPEAAEKDKDSMDFINKVREALERNLTTENYTIQTMSCEMGVSRTVFFNKMKALTGKAPTDYMLTFKMEKAKMLLESGQYSVGEVADMLGFCDAKYFGKKFKRYFHICPTGYMKKKGIIQQ